MCKLIGVYAAPGTGRKTAAWLLAKTIEEIKHRTPFDKYEILYKCWCELVIRDAKEAYSTTHCTLDSFGGHILDQLRLFCPVLDGLNLKDEHQINNYYINLSTWAVTNDKFDNNVVPLTNALRYIHDHDEFPPEWALTVADFIMYFAKHVMKRYFGEDVWLKVAKFSNQIMASEDYRIYYDVKTQAELNYLDVVIYLINTQREKEGGYREIWALDPDFTIDTTAGLETCARDFYDIALTILNKNGN